MNRDSLLDEEAFRSRMIPIGKTLAGGQGEFRFCRDSHSGRIVGIKTMLEPKLGVDNHYIVRYARETCLALLMPRHPGVNRFEASILSESGLTSLIQAVPGCTLRRRFAGCEPASNWPIKLDLVLQAVEALLDLDQHFRSYGSVIGGHDFFHGDIHSDNLMVTPEGRVVLIDWGQSYRFDSRKNLYPAVPPEYSPESRYFRQGRDVHGAEVDVYSLGVLVWNLCFGGIPRGTVSYRPVSGQPGEGVPYAVFLHDPIVPTRGASLGDTAQVELGRLLVRMVSEDFKSRPDMKEVHKGLESILDKIGHPGRTPPLLFRLIPQSSDLLYSALSLSLAARRLAAIGAETDALATVDLVDLYLYNNFAMMNPADRERAQSELDSIRALAQGSGSCSGATPGNPSPGADMRLTSIRDRVLQITDYLVSLRNAGVPEIDHTVIRRAARYIVDGVLKSEALQVITVAEASLAMYAARTPRFSEMMRRLFCSIYTESEPAARLDFLHHRYLEITRNDREHGAADSSDEDAFLTRSLLPWLLAEVERVDPESPDFIYLAMCTFLFAEVARRREALPDRERAGIEALAEQLLRMEVLGEGMAEEDLDSVMQSYFAESAITAAEMSRGDVAASVAILLRFMRLRRRRWICFDEERDLRRLYSASTGLELTALEKTLGYRSADGSREIAAFLDAARSPGDEAEAAADLFWTRAGLTPTASARRLSQQLYALLPPARDSGPNPRPEYRLLASAQACPAYNLVRLLCARLLEDKRDLDAEILYRESEIWESLVPLLVEPDLCKRFG